MTSRSFRRLFPQLNIQSIPEDEFYQQASLSQLLTGPDEQELASFRPNVRDPLELVEATPELAGMLGSSLESVDSCWDTLEASPPLTHHPSLSPPQCILPPLPPQQQDAKPDPKVKTIESNLGLQRSAPVAKLHVSKWKPHSQEGKNVEIPSLTKPGITVTASIWEPQGQQIQNPGINGSTNSDSTGNFKNWEQPQQENTTFNSGVDGNAWEPQRLRCRSSGNSDTKVVNAGSKPSQLQNKDIWNFNPAHLKGEANTNIWSMEVRVLDSPDTPALVEPRLKSHNPENLSPVKPDIWDRQGIKKTGGSSTASKRDTKTCENYNQTCKAIKMDAAWQRSLTNVRVHIRDLGLKVASIQKDLKKEPVKTVGKTPKTKTRS